MRRITRRIGLFGGPGAMVRAAVGKAKRLTRQSVQTQAPLPPAGAEALPETAKKSSWLDWFRGSKL